MNVRWITASMIGLGVGGVAIVRAQNLVIPRANPTPPLGGFRAVTRPTLMSGNIDAARSLFSAGGVDIGRNAGSTGGGAVAITGTGIASTSKAIENRADLPPFIRAAAVRALAAAPTRPMAASNVVSAARTSAGLPKSSTAR